MFSPRGNQCANPYTYLYPQQFGQQSTAVSYVIPLVYPLVNPQNLQTSVQTQAQADPNQLPQGTPQQLQYSTTIIPAIPCFSIPQNPFSTQYDFSITPPPRYHMIEGIPLRFKWEYSFWHDRYTLREVEDFQSMDETFGCVGITHHLTNFGMLADSLFGNPVNYFPPGALGSGAMEEKGIFWGRITSPLFRNCQWIDHMHYFFDNLTIYNWNWPAATPQMTVKPVPTQVPEKIKYAPTETAETRKPFEIDFSNTVLEGTVVPEGLTKDGRVYGHIDFSKITTTVE